MVPIPIVRPPSSPSLIDFTAYDPKPTLLDDVDLDTFFLPPPPAPPPHLFRIRSSKTASRSAGKQPINLWVPGTGHTNSVVPEAKRVGGLAIREGRAQSKNKELDKVVDVQPFVPRWLQQSTAASSSEFLGEQRDGAQAVAAARSQGTLGVKPIALPRLPEGITGAGNRSGSGVDWGPPDLDTYSATAAPAATYRDHEHSPPPWNTVSPSGRLYFVPPKPVPKSRPRPPNQASGQSSSAFGSDSYHRRDLPSQHTAKDERVSAPIPSQSAAASINVQLGNGSTLTFNPGIGTTAPLVSDSSAKPDPITSGLEKLISALQKLALEPPIAPPDSPADHIAPVSLSPLRSTDAQALATLSKKARKKERQRLQKEQELNAEAQLQTLLASDPTKRPTPATFVPPTIDWNLHPSADDLTQTAPSRQPFASTFPVPQTTFDCPPLQPLPRKKYDHATPPDLESPPDHLPTFLASNNHNRTHIDPALNKPPETRHTANEDENEGDAEVDYSHLVYLNAADLPQSSTVGAANTGNYSEDKSIILTSEQEAALLFQLNIKAAPNPRFDYPSVPSSIPAALKPPVARGARSRAVELPYQSVNDNKIWQTGAYTERPAGERFEEVLKQLGIEGPSGFTQEKVDQHLSSILNKYAENTKPWQPLFPSQRRQSPTPTPPSLSRQSHYPPIGAYQPPYGLASSGSALDNGRQQTSHYPYSYTHGVPLALDTRVPDLTRIPSHEWEEDYLHTPGTGPVDLPESERGRSRHVDIERHLDRYSRHSGLGHVGLEGVTATRMEPGKVNDPGVMGLGETDSMGQLQSSVSNARMRWQGNAGPVPEAVKQPANWTGSSVDDATSDSSDDYTLLANGRSDRPATHSALSDIAPYDLLAALKPARRRVPPTLYGRGTSDILQRTLMQSWISAETSDSHKLGIASLTARLTSLINNTFAGHVDGENRFVVDIFGSVSWGGDMGRGGDLDLVVRDKRHPQGFHPDLWTDAPKPTPSSSRGVRHYNPPESVSPLYNLRYLVSALWKSGFVGVQGILHASTPIVKFKDRATGMDCDINVNDLGGWYNSKLILAYCEISPFVLRPLIHVLKMWAKVNCVNDPSGSKGPASMSSYCLVLMAIAYLQHRGALPNLQADVEVRIPELSQDIASDVVWTGWGRESGTKIHIDFCEQAPSGWSPADPSLTAAQAVRGFFEFFAIGEVKRRLNGQDDFSSRFDYQRQVVSIANGGIINRAKLSGSEALEILQRRQQGLPPLTKEELAERESRMGKGASGIQPRNWTERRLVVQDPFIWQKNCTQSISKAGLDRWLAAARIGYLNTTRADCTYESLLANTLPPPAGEMPMAGRGRTPSPFRGSSGRRGQPGRNTLGQGVRQTAQSGQPGQPDGRTLWMG